MKRQIVILILCLAFLAPCFGAKEEIVFESVLKDAIFMPLYVSDNYIQKTVPHFGWWTLKFENGAVITFYRGTELLPKSDIWWIGKTYIVSKKGFGENYFFIKLKQEEEIK